MRGRKTGGGSRKGCPNKATANREAEIKASGLTPLDYMLSTLRDETKDHVTRMDAAKSAAPFVHPRLSQVDANHGGELDVRAWLQSLGEPD